jgi:hypothetical protein
MERNLLLNTVCAIVKSDGSVHQKELTSINHILDPFQEELANYHVDLQKLKTDLILEFELINKRSEDYFKNTASLLEGKYSFGKQFLDLVLKICQKFALIVNQMNKSELIMLSRLESIFKNYLS